LIFFSHLLLEWLTKPTEDNDIVKIYDISLYVRLT
jgi:hypothetical protein